MSWETRPPVVAIAGAAGGLGPHVARHFAAQGATLALAGRDEGRLSALAGELALPGERVEVRAVDLLDEAATHDWADGLAGRFGHVDALLHLVGGWRGGKPIDEAPLEDWGVLSDLLVRTVQHTSRAFGRHLIASRSGRFALISSKAAQAPTHTNAAYAAAKAAAEAWTFALAHSFAAEGLPSPATANVVAVNAIVTPEMRAAEPEKSFATCTAAEDIAAALAYLCSDAAANMNGRRLVLHA